MFPLKVFVMTLTISSLAVMLILASSSMASEEQYPTANLVLEPSELSAMSISKTQPCILDARPKDRYLAGHVPGAIWVDHATWSKTFDDGRQADEWSRRIGSLGIEPNTTAIVYDDAVKDAARIWWILRYWGIKDVRLLNGGWRAWQKSGLPVAHDVPQKFGEPWWRPSLTPRDYLATKEQVLDSLKSGKSLIVDARSSNEHCGIERTAKRNGSIPGAVNLEWTEVIDPQTQRFKTAEQLAKLFKDAGIDLNRPAITHCQSGGRAAVMAFAMELMGAHHVRNYYKSWAEWGNAPDTPVVKPGLRK
jgi:thiosulfate/3-mercaptopyruvate sulfurtransferase